MKSLLGVCLLASLAVSAAWSRQDPANSPLRPGIAVQMPSSSQAVEARSADEPSATVVSVTADGKLFVGVQPAQWDDLGKLNAKTVYIKADARVPYQGLLAVLDALRGHSLVLLAEPRSQTTPTEYKPPYGVQLSLGPTQ